MRGVRGQILTYLTIIVIIVTTYFYFRFSYAEPFNENQIFLVQASSQTNAPAQRPHSQSRQKAPKNADEELIGVFGGEYFRAEFLLAKNSDWCRESTAYLILDRDPNAHPTGSGPAYYKAEEQEEKEQSRVVKEVLHRIEHDCPGVKLLRFKERWGGRDMPNSSCAREERAWQIEPGLGKVEPCTAAADRAMGSFNEMMGNIIQSEEFKGKGDTAVANKVKQKMVENALGWQKPVVGNTEPIVRSLRAVQIDALIADGHYVEANAKIDEALKSNKADPMSKVYANRNQSLDGAERIALLTSRGEAQLGNRQLLQAVAAYKEAMDVQDKQQVRFVEALPAVIALGTLYERMGKYEEAIAVYELALNSVSEGDHARFLNTRIAATYHARAIVEQDASAADSAGRYYLEAVRQGSVRAERAGGQAFRDDLLADLRKGGLPTTFGAAVAIPAIELARLYEETDRSEDAASIAAPVLRALEDEPATEPFLVDGRTVLAAALISLNRNDEARANLDQAIPRIEPLLGADHPVMAFAFTQQARLQLAQGRAVDAMNTARRATDIYVENAARLSGASGVSAQASLIRAARAFDVRLAAAWEVYRSSSGAEAAAAAADSFETQQWVQQSSAAAALSQMAVRVGAGGGELGSLVRERQDLIVRWERLDDRSVAKSGITQLPQSAQDVQMQQRQILQRITAIDQVLQQKFPQYAELASPKPLSVAQTQALLRSDETLVAFHSRQSKTFVWAVHKGGVAWAEVLRGGSNLAETVRRFRCGLINEEDNACASSDMKFDWALAHDMYRSLLEPVEGATKGRRDLIVVSNGALAALPVHALLRAPLDPQVTGLDARRQAEWLIREWAVTTIPAVSSLRALRALAHENATARRPLIGFGDPVIGNRPIDGANTCADPEPTRRSATASVASLYRSGTYVQDVAVADVDRVRTLPRLPDTRCELLDLAHTLGVDAGVLQLGVDATELKVKTFSRSGELATYQNVAFATHGLLAGEFGVEPALVLTPPKLGTTDDDGLLTTSEVAGLKLQADWVILSACNTAAGNRPGEDSLSGLARAFFYAGAKTLLVSHWPVRSEAAVDLTTGTFAQLQQHPDLGRAEALRLTMLQLIERGRAPNYWAPFSVVGEGH